MIRVSISVKNVTINLALLCALTSGVGCSMTPATPYTAEYYLISISECKETELLNDLQIVRCASKVEETLRQRYNNARVARTGGGVIQVITAGVSSMLTGLGGANGLTAGTILSGISAIMPEVSEIVEAKGRTEAYADGMKSIGTGLATYRKSIAENNEGIMDSFKLTPAGAALYGTLRAAISVVEDRLAGLLPTTEDLKKSRSELERFERIQVIPGSVSLKKTENTTLKIAGGGPVRAASGNSSIVTTEELEGGLAVKIIAGAQDCRWTMVNLANGSGARESVVVRVETNPTFEVSPVDTSLKIGTPIVLQLLGGVDTCPITEVRSTNPELVKVEIGKDGRSIGLTALKVGDKPTRIFLKNGSGRSTSLDVKGVE